MPACGNVLRLARIWKYQLTLYVVLDLSLGLLLGLAVRRFVVLLVPVAVWTIWGIGTDRQWWGNGGEQILLGTATLIGLGLIGTAFGVGVRRLVARSMTWRQHS